MNDQQQWTEFRKRQQRSWDTREKVDGILQDMTPQDQVRLARDILQSIGAAGTSYADFESAQAAQRDIRKAARLLGWIS